MRRFPNQRYHESDPETTPHQGFMGRGWRFGQNLRLEAGSRWHIEETFKRLKHRLNLEHIFGLSQLAVLQDVAAKIVADNLQALTVLTAHDRADLAGVDRINQAYAHTARKPLLPALLLRKKSPNCCVLCMN